MNEASTWVCLILAQLLVAFATSHWFLYHKVVRNIAPSPGWDPSPLQFQLSNSPAFWSTFIPLSGEALRE